MTHEILTSVSALSGASKPNTSIKEHSSWWDYFRATQEGRLTPVALQVLEADASDIANLIAPRDIEGMALEQWGPGRIRTGIVVGSVQSGKTASMLAASSMLLDRGVGIVLLICGTQVALWLQTFERILEQLDGTEIDSAGERNQERVLIPNPGDVFNDQTRLTPIQYMASQRFRMLEAIKDGRPIIAVIPKIDAHLSAFKRTLEHCIRYGALAERSGPLVMAVFDDEADDSSVLEAEDGNKLTPRRIESIWTLGGPSSKTTDGQLFTTYVAYTATPQANFLQESHNPLAPRDFRFVLRTPGVKGQITPRESVFQEPAGLHRYYTGGWAFYSAIRDSTHAICQTFPFPEKMDSEDVETFIFRAADQREKMLGEALRSYMVGGAIRLAYSRRSLVQIAGQESLSLDLLSQLLPDPHSMLYHPSGDVDTHFHGAREISKWSKGLPIWDGSLEDSGLDQAVPQIDPEKLALRLEHEEMEWSKWLEMFKGTAEGLRMLPMAVFPFLDKEITWPIIKRILLEEIFPSVKVRVLNSDPNASERPGFKPVASLEDGTRYLPPPDLMSIFVAGNVLSRGVTIEGLATSLFLRSVREPSADTQMQMQRWFGYRGKYLPLCRVFLFLDQYELFRTYHEDDEATKYQLLAEIKTEELAGSLGPVILHGPFHVATKKVPSNKVPLWPGSFPFIRLVELENNKYALNNLEVLNLAMSEGKWANLEAPVGKVRGLIRQDPVEIIEIANLLELLLYSQHVPSQMEEQYRRWSTLGLQLGVPNPGLLRLPNRQINGLVGEDDPRFCPYSIAAYLRLWETLAHSPFHPGFRTTEDGTTSWKMVESGRHLRLLPKFYIGVRFGEQDWCDFPLPLPVRPMVRKISPSGILSSTWGSRGTEASYFGDQYFDYHYHQTLPLPNLHHGNGWRRAGHPGLLLFHLIKGPDGKELVALGLSIPKGGPDHIAALRR